MARQIVLPDTPEVNRKLMALKPSVRRRLLELSYFHEMQKAGALPRRSSGVRVRARRVGRTLRGRKALNASQA